MHRLAQLDHRYVWHPFTQMKDWVKDEPRIIVRGHGAVVEDVYGREYLDANSSIWTNLHGHNHPKINKAITRQLNKIAHSSALGLANEPATRLAKELVDCAQGARGNVPRRAANASTHPKSGPQPRLAKVFFSDDGSTAVEVALKLAYEYSRRTGKSRRPCFLSLEGAYHGDTVGAVALGHIDLFHQAYSGLLFKTDRVMAPYCYRCPFNRAKPERADARSYRNCNWECVDVLEKKVSAQTRRKHPYAAFVFEPLLQGAAGMIAHPPGWLRRTAEIARGHGALLIADEVLTGFGRARVPEPQNSHSDNENSTSALFACQSEHVSPDFLVLAKGLTGGYLPMGATLTTQRVFDAFLGQYEEFKTFFHGHSYTGNQLAAAAALANLELLRSPTSLRARVSLQENLSTALQTLWRLPNVGDVRQVGAVAGIELVRDWRTREPFDLREQAGIRVCAAMARRGVLTRPIGNVVVLMPPYCATPKQVRKMTEVLADAIVAEM